LSISWFFSRNTDISGRVIRAQTQQQQQQQNKNKTKRSHEQNISGDMGFLAHGLFSNTDHIFGVISARKHAAKQRERKPPRTAREKKRTNKRRSAKRMDL
jgi:hypothetical protein